MSTVESIIARHVAKMRYEDLPPEIVEVTKEKLFDTLAVIVAGVAAPGCDIIERQLVEWEGKPESTVLVSGHRLPAISAAQIHASWAHAYDYDDNDDRNATKASVTVIPGALALAERQKSAGKDLLLAIAVGVDLAVRIGLAINPKPSATARHEGYFSGAAAGAKLLGLDEEDVLNAMGIGYSQLAITGKSIEWPSLTKRLIPGQIARDTVWASVLAQKGFPSIRGFLSGKNGYFCKFRGQEGDLEELTRDLGKRFEVRHAPKPYPACRFTHAPIDAALALMKANRFNVNDVTGVTLGLGNRAMSAVGGVSDGKKVSPKYAPLYVVDAQFSAPFIVATALRTGGLALKDFSDAALHDPTTLALAAKVQTVHRADFDDVKWGEAITPASMEIALKDGRKLTTTVQWAKGNIANPCSRKELIKKFEECLENTGKPFNLRVVKETLDEIDHLEESRDIGKLLQRLVSRPGR